MREVLNCLLWTLEIYTKARYLSNDWRTIGFLCWWLSCSLAGCLVVRMIIDRASSCRSVTALSGRDNGIYSSNHLHLRSLFHHVDRNVHQKKKRTLPVWCFDNSLSPSLLAWTSWYASGLPASLTNLVQTLLKHITSLQSSDLLRVANTRWKGRLDQSGGSKWADQTRDQSPPRDSARSKWVGLGLKWSGHREFWREGF